MLLHLVDGTQDDVVAAYQVVRGELDAYGHGLHEKTEVIGLNKCDALDPEEIAEKASALAEAAGQPVMTLSGATHQGVEPVLFALIERIREAREAGDE